MFKKLISLAAVFAAAAAMTLSVSAEEYGEAGIQWMIKDQWAHRNAVGLDPLNEMETDTLDVTHEDAVITGNGDYTVSMYGWVVPDEDIDYVEVGTLGLSTSIDFDENPDCVIELTECVIDGVTYTFDEQPELEDENNCHVMKIKNAYGSNAVTTPEMDASPWRSADPITISFTVSGLPEDKIADNPDETLVRVYASAASEETESAEEETAEIAADGDTESESGQTDGVSAEVSEEDESDGNSDSSASSSPRLIIVIVIAAAAVVLLAVIIAIIVRTSKKK